MKNTFVKLIIIAMIFLMALPFNCVLGSESAAESSSTEGLVDNMNPDQLKELDYEEIQTDSIFEKVFTSFALSMGDYAHEYLSQIFKEEITIDKIVYNDVVLLNANFFDRSTNPAASVASKTVKEFINEWFAFFQKLALVVIMICVVGAGIKILLHTPEAKVSAYDSLKKVVMAVLLIYFFPYVMRYAFDINEAIIQHIKSEYIDVDQTLGTAITQVSDLMMDELEFRSPQYVSLAGLRVGAGTTEATQLYLNRLEQYASTADVMRMMRAFAGVTLRFMYVILWYIMLAQTYILVIIYLKRYITIAFLIIIYPLVIAGYITGNMFGQRQNAFNTWCKKFFSNVFLQTMHAIIYGVISGIVITQVKDMMVDSKLNSINWLLMIIATSFLFSAERILSKLWNAAIDTSERKGMKSLLNAPGQFMKNIKGG